ncbi:ornithine cyclodeaminase family protein [Clostridium aminobutyricum]|uniref:Ornithine cyclodeaminase family protein n=1 Tax=Clostridium aminobutyricum TaxID=33953 RepID=A0A939D9Y8_CLOAM|nr:ornithine cyclodeaminase family protein [Clostridium aminobutyricum]MBN7773433.1 ornithine cyclodeaminase family protein [Clostridium aminobutyricum]
MFELKVLCKEETEKILKINTVIRSVEEVYRQKALGETEVFPLIFHEFTPGVADMDIKSGWLKGSGLFGLKLVSWYGENAKKQLPALIGTILLFDDKTGAPIGILDGAYITGIRTGAAGALGAKYLARPDSERLLIVGAGHVAAFQVAATLTLFPNIKEVMIYDAMDYKSAEEFVQNIQSVLVNNLHVPFNESIEFVAVKDIKGATGKSDIIITVTPAREPIIMAEWVKPGTHFSCIGADMSGKEEIDPEILRGARIFVDDMEQCIHVGEIEIPIKKNIIKKEDIAGEIGEIIAGVTKGRENDEQITVFDATGTALLDLITAKLAFDEAEKMNLGTSVNL